MTRRTRVYVSGPLTSSGLETHNAREAITVAEELWQRGYQPFCPHLTVLWGFLYPEKPHAEWIEMDKGWVDVCDILVRIPGQSKGADMEVEHAFSQNIPVFTLEWDDLLQEYDLQPLLKNYPAERNSL